MDSGFIATVIKKTDMVAGTVDAIAKVLSWSFNVMLSGKTPQLDWMGKPLGDGGNNKNISVFKISPEIRVFGIMSDFQNYHKRN